MIANKIASNKNVYNQPKALKFLFLAELWERFSFYGLRALLIFYLVSQPQYNDMKAYSLYGIYLTLIYATTIIGGYLADRHLGNLKVIFLGSIIIIIGHLFLFLPYQGFFIYGLSFVLIGTSLFKSNVSSLLGEYYSKNDPRRDAGFTLFYMGINIGSLIAPIVCGYVGYKYGWHYGFGCAGIGMIIGLIVLFWGYQDLKEKGQPPYPQELYKKGFLNLTQYQWIIMGCLLSVPFFAWMIEHHESMGNFLNLFGLGIIIVLAILTFQSKGEERKAMLTILIMLPFVTAFFASFEQAGASMNLFTDRYVDRSIGTFEIPTTWFQSLNPLFVVMLAPFFSLLWSFLGRLGKDPLTPMKFVLALFQVGLSFWFLKMAVSEATSGNKASMIWLILAYLFQTMGELCLNPVGLSMITKLAPARFASFLMGCFFLSIAFANLMAQQVAQYFTMAQEEKMLETFTKDRGDLIVFGHIFEFLIYSPILAGIVLLIISPFLKKTFLKY